MSRRLARITLMLLGLALLGLSVYTYYRFGNFRYIGSFEGLAIHKWEPAPQAVVVSLFLVVAGFLVFALSLRPSPKNINKSIIIIIISIILIILTAISYIPTQHYYTLRTPITTDSYILEIEAAKAIIHGKNPYTTEYREALINSIPPDPYTWIYRDPTPPYTPDEITGFVDKFDYLAAAALYYIPAVALGIPPYIWDSIILSIGFLILLLKLSDDAKYIYIALLSIGTFIYIAPIIGKTTVTGWAIPFILAMAYMDNPLIAGPLLAWATSYRVYVGFFSLFYLIAQYREGYNARKTLLYAIITGLIINLPFLAADPQSFIRSFLIPYRLNLNPLDMGPGFSNLGYLGLFINKYIYTIVIFIIIFIGLILSYKYYDILKYNIFLFPAIALFFYHRPNYIYYIYFPYAALIAYLTGKIKLPDETKQISPIEGLRLSTVVLATSIAATLGIVEFVPQTPLHKAIVAGVALVSPITILLYKISNNLFIYRKKYILIFALFLIISSISSGIVKKTYYIIYNLDNIKQLIISSARGTQLTAPVRSVIESRGLPIIPGDSFQHAPHFEPPSLSLLPSLLLRIISLNLFIYIIILFNLFLLIYIILLLWKKTGSMLPFLALMGAPSVLIGATGLQVQEHFLILGLFLLLFSFIFNNRFSIAIAALGSLVLGLSVPLGPLIAVYALYPVFHKRFNNIINYIILFVGAILSLLIPSGYISAFTYKGFCLADLLGIQAVPSTLLMISTSLALIAVDTMYGPTLWVSAIAPGIIAGASCSLHAVAILLWASILWWIARDPAVSVRG